MPEIDSGGARQLIDRILALSGDIRYAALYQDQALTSRQRTAVLHKSAEGSDRYEELLVNPAILLLVRQRGNIDCGGAQWVVIRYGRFFQLVVDLPDGHVSVCFELTANPLDLAERIREICASQLSSIT